MKSILFHANPLLFPLFGTVEIATKERKDGEIMMKLLCIHSLVREILNTADASTQNDFFSQECFL